MQSGATLSLVRGDDISLGLTVVNPDGSAYNLVGCTLTITARRDTYFSTIIFQKSVSIFADAASGVASIDFVPADTVNMDDAPYYFDVKLLDSSAKTTTLSAGVLSIVPF